MPIIKGLPYSIYVPPDMVGIFVQVLSHSVEEEKSRPKIPRKPLYLSMESGPEIEHIFNNPQEEVCDQELE